jgi:hypothetical protein
MAQNRPWTLFGETTSVGAANGLPLWIDANRWGAVQEEEWQFSQSLGIRSESQVSHWLRLEPVVEGRAVASDSSELQLREGYIGVGLSFLELWLGSRKQTVGELPLQELSTGSLAVSTNAQPIPRVVFQTDGFVPVPLSNKKLFLDDRYVEAAFFLHEKWGYLDYRPEERVSVKFGLVHEAQ